MNDSDGVAFAAGIGVALIFGLVLLWIIDPVGAIQRDAVKHNAAVYVAQPDGSVKWQWKDDAKKELHP